MARKLATVLTLLAVTANSAAAGLMPCCCVHREQPQKPSCCLKRPADPEKPRASCCATKKVAGHPPECSQPIVERQSCGCVKSLPAMPPARQAARLHHQIDLNGSLVTNAVIFADFPRPADRIWQVRPGFAFPTSPPLSVLYCVWVE
jgi:hypothetical protein